MSSLTNPANICGLLIVGPTLQWVIVVNACIVRKDNGQEIHLLFRCVMQQRSSGLIQFDHFKICQILFDALLLSNASFKITPDV